MSFNRLQFQQFMTNPPQGWNDYDMDWNNPDSLGFKYWYTLWLAAQERLSVLPTLSMSYPITTPPPYSVNMRRDWIYRFLKGIEQIAKYYVDLDFSLANPPIDLFDTIHAVGNTNNINKIFPYVFNYNRLVTLYPSFEKYLGNYLTNSIQTDVHNWQLKELMLDIYSLLNKLVYAVPYLRTRPGVVSTSARSGIDGDFSDFVQLFLDDFAAYTDTYMSYNKVSSNDIGYGDANDQRVSGGVTVGVIAGIVYRDTYDHDYIRYDYRARPYIVKKFAAQIPNDRLPNLLQLTYVLHLDFVQNNYLNLDTFGYTQGLSVKDLGQYDGYRDVEIVSADKLKFPLPSQLPSVEWDGNTPKEYKYLLNGCRMSVALLLDYRRSFLFNNHQLDDDISNSNSE